MGVMLEQFPFEERWAALETPRFDWGPAPFLSQLSQRPHPSVRQKVARINFKRFSRQAASKSKHMTITIFHPSSSSVSTKAGSSGLTNIRLV